MIGKTIQKIRATIIFIFCILIFFFFCEDVGDFEKTQVEEDISFPPLEVGSLKAKGLVEISNRLIWFLLCRLHVMNLLKIVGVNTIIMEIAQQETE